MGVAWEVPARPGSIKQKEAIRWEALEAEEENVPMKNSLSLLEFLTKYLEFSKVKHGKETFGEKRTAFRLLLKSLLPETLIKDIGRIQILGHLQGQAMSRSGNAANKDRKNLVAAWNWGLRYIEGFPAVNPCYVDRFPEVRQRRYVPPEKDFWKAVGAANTEQDRVMLFCYLHLGARRKELFQLRWEDIDFVTQQVRLYTRKRRDGSLEYDHLPMTDDLLAMLVEHRRQASTGWVFPDPATGEPYTSRQHWMGNVCRRAGVKPFGLHGIRHLTASILVQADMPLIDVQTILRHKALSTTERYVHRLKSVKASLKVLEGRGSGKIDRLKQDKLKVVGESSNTI